MTRGFSQDHIFGNNIESQKTDSMLNPRKADQRKNIVEISAKPLLGPKR